MNKVLGTLRAPLFGRALHTVNDNDTFLLMMVKGNVDLLAELFGLRCTKISRKLTHTLLELLLDESSLSCITPC
jgi:hypothetical protein